MIIFRYLNRELYFHLLAIMVVLLIIFITNQFVRYINCVASGELTMGVVMKIMSLQVPLLLSYLLPLGVYLSLLLVFGRLYTDHEMTVLNACGISKIQLLGMVSLFCLMVMALVAWLMLWAVPMMENYQIKTMNN